MVESTVAKYGIVQFDGKDFTNWRFRVEVLFLQQNLFDHIDKSPPTKKGDEWIESEKKAKLLLIQCIADSHLEYIKHQKTSYDMWQTLKKLFERKSISGQIYLRKQLLSMKFDESSDMQSHLLKFDKVLSSLKSAGAKMEDEDAVCHLLLTMPSSYSSIIAAIETIVTDKLTLEFVKCRLLDEDMKRKNSQDVDQNIETGTAFSGKHKKFSKNQKKFYIKCYACGKMGHKKADCWSKKTTNKQANETSRETHDVVSFMVSPNLSLDTRGDDLVMYVDSGATDHLVNNDKMFTNYNELESPIYITVAKNGESLKVTKIGEILVTSWVDDRPTVCNLTNVLYAENLRNNLLSVSKLMNAGINVNFQDKVVKFTKNGTVIAKGFQTKNLYMMKFKLRNRSVNVCGERNGADIWHKRLGHLGMTSMKKMQSFGLLNVEINKPFECDSCIKGKQCKLPYQEWNSLRSKRPLELVHSDVCGPIIPSSYDGKKFYVCFTDDYTRFTMTYLMTNKSEVSKFFKEYEAVVTSHWSKKIARIRCDNGGEYVSHEFKNFCKQKGIQIEFTVPYSPQQNGVAERKNRTLIEKARTMIIGSGLGRDMWGEAVLTATYLMNRSPTVVIRDKVPAELWYGRKINLSHLRIFGCLAYKHVPQQKRSKLDSKSEECIMIGYAPCGYRLLNLKNNDVVIGRDVIFNELLTFREFSKKNERPSVSNDPEDIQVIENGEEESHQNLIRSARNRRLPEKFKDFVIEEENSGHWVMNVQNIIHDVPENYQQAMNSPERKEWIKAIEREMEFLKKNDTWHLVECPKVCEVIDNKWVFQLKHDEDGNLKKYKARLVARGFNQVKGVNYSETFAPVVNMVTIRTFMVIATRYGWPVRQLDVKTAFLNGRLSEIIYMKQPVGYEGDERLVCRLNKSLYGLKQSSKCWNDSFNHCMSSMAFIRSKSDSCLYYKIRQNSKVFLIIYVDDVLITGDDEVFINDSINQLKKQFEMEDMGLVKFFMGIYIVRHIRTRTMVLSQKQCIINVLKRFNMLDCNGITTPMETNLTLKKCEDKNEITSHPFRQLVGCLMYIMLGTRPDICFAMNYLSRFQDCASDEHWKHLKRILRYLKQTIDFVLVYNPNDDSLHGYVDADWAGDISDRKSTTGYLLKVFGCTVSWKTKKQQCVTLSSTESEYLAVSVASQDILWLKRVLNDFSIQLLDALVLFEDNQGCIFIAKNLETKRSKHIDIRYHFVREKVLNGEIELKYVETKSQEADMFTKPLARTVFEKFRQSVGLKINPIEEE